LIVGVDEFSSNERIVYSTRVHGTIPAIDVVEELYLISDDICPANVDISGVVHLG